MAKAKTNRVPRTRANGEWTEAGFWGWVRSGLRSMTKRWPPIARHARNFARRKYIGSNPQQKWEYQCAVCAQWFKGREVHVDHIIPCGTLKNYNDLPEFVARLFCEVDNLQIICETCHNIKTYNKSLPHVLNELYFGGYANIEISGWDDGDMSLNIKEA